MLGVALAGGCRSNGSRVAVARRAQAAVPPRASHALDAAAPHAPGAPAVTSPLAAPATARVTGPEPPPVGPVALTGCPPRPRPRAAHPPRPRPWRPGVLVPDDALPEPAAAPPRAASLAALEGSGVWIWRARLCEGGDAAAIVARAVAAGMRQLWVRVGDSRDGFYGAPVLEALVPRAHAAGLAVIGWGFPYLYDPAADAAWTRAALEWRAADGSMLDGFSPDIETASEGTRLTARRVVLYLSLARPASVAPPARPLIATVFRPTRHWLRAYPYRAMAPYVDAFAPMVYWSCHEPGDAGASAVARLSPLAPVHVIGQGYDMAEEGGREGVPSAAEIARFCDASRRAGARGASLWHWQSMTDETWRALGACWWPGAPASAAVTPVIESGPRWSVEHPRLAHASPQE